jgi:hypothetical protein
VLFDGPDRIYGFSSSIGAWSGVTLDSGLRAELAGSYLGYVRTENRIYAFNSTTNGWYSTAIVGTPIGEDVQSTTAVFWSDQACFGISTVWGVWRTHEISNPLGGGSGGNYALVWCSQEALAYSSSTGQWASQPLSGVPLGGYASPGLGMIWTQTAAHIYDPIARLWSVLSLQNPEGIMMDGSGKVGVVWSPTSADAYSGYLGTWSPLAGDEEFQGGVAADEVAVMWTETRAFAFDPHLGNWVELSIGYPAGLPSGSSLPDAAFSIWPNPAQATPLFIHLPPSEQPWMVDIVDVMGARVRSLESAGGMIDATIEWDQRNEAGYRVAAGTYWVRARAGERVEARRFTVVR